MVSKSVVVTENKARKPSIKRAKTAKKAVAKRRRGRDWLTAKEVESYTKPGYYADGGGLYLQVSRAGTKSWIFRYRSAHKQKAREMGLGSLSVISLKMARELADSNRALTAQRIDPIERRDTERSKHISDTAARKTFRECAEERIDDFRHEWKNAKHADQWRNTLATYAYPVIGEMPVGDVGLEHILRIVKPIWATKTETASRVRSRLELVLNWATTNKYRSGENPARWRGNLDSLLAKPTKVKKPRPHEAIAFDGIAAFMVKLRKQTGIASAALEFLILTGTRVNETVKAQWGEIDGDTWTIPAERMKADRAHRVPLSGNALAVLKRMAPLRDKSGFVFPSPMKTGQPVTDAALLAIVKTLAGDKYTTHGFRSTFRDWAAETTSYPNIVAEAALAHAIGDKTEAAYRRGDLFEKRRRMMADWAKFCGTVQAKGSNVVNLRRA